MKALKNKIAFKTKMIAPCGMNCELCMAHLRAKHNDSGTKCLGCNITDPNKPSYCARQCHIKYCPNLKGKYCYQCDEYPCQRLKRLDKRYRTRYNMSMIENLNKIKENGIKQFVKEEEKRWECPKCGEVICVHNGQCYSCESKKMCKK